MMVRVRKEGEREREEISKRGYRWVREKKDTAGKRLNFFYIEMITG